MQLADDQDTPVAGKGTVEGSIEVRQGGMPVGVCIDQPGERKRASIIIDTPCAERHAISRKTD